MRGKLAAKGEIQVERIADMEGRPGLARPAFAQLSKKLLSFRLRLGCFSLRKAFASI